MKILNNKNINKFDKTLNFLKQIKQIGIYFEF